ncbi:MAG: SusD/RagB family nutrient-binding outer membrane lipoprotein [Bacteroidales bacterium]|nr:SusD/RagB family nutrient-binding outer membrane lipoprotein [Bacteroidales bacterium]
MAAAIFQGCSKWEEYNTDPYGVTNELLSADFNDVGAYFPTIEQGIYNNTCLWAWEMQTAQNLTADTWCGYMQAPTPFQNNINPSTLFLIRSWVGGMWDLTYRDVMSPIFTSIQSRQEDYPHFYAVAQIMRAVAMIRVSDSYGPVVYSKYGTGSTGASFDTQEEAYNHVFAELESAKAALKAFIQEYPDAKPFEPFDLLLGGDFNRWIRFANSVQLRAAMRIVKVNPSLARQKAEAAVADGVLEDGTVSVSGKGWVHPLSTLGTDWNDCCMNAEMESILLGYNDPRVGKFFKPCSDADAKEAGYSYKGIRMGIEMAVKDIYAGHSAPNFGGDTPGLIMSSAEVWFLRAEGALRGWSGMGGSAKDLYEKGVQTSFDQWGAGDAGAYLQSDNMPAAYVDVKNPANSIPADSPYMNRVSPKWDESASNEIKLQKIITQKWIACYPEGMEAWSEQRRTGYPVLFPVMVNESQGVFKNDDNVKRMTFPESLEWTGQLSEATQKLGGPDSGNTRLWWDTGKGNF